MCCESTCHLTKRTHRICHVRLCLLNNFRPREPVFWTYSCCNQFSTTMEAITDIAMVSIISKIVEGASGP